MEAQELEFEKAELPELLRALDEELTQCEALKGAEALLKEQVEESREEQEKVERKAMEVAKELMESSRAIAWLKSEVATQREQEDELEEMKLENSRMRERLESHEEQEDEDESKRASVVSEALQVAWEGEARAHRQAEQKLQNLQASLLPVRLQMLRLAELLKLRGVDLTNRFKERLTLEALQQLAQQASQQAAQQAVESSQRPSPSPIPLLREPLTREPVAREPVARRPQGHGTKGPLYRLVPLLEPSPARRRLDLEQEQRFDAYSVHRPRRR